jgi:hypothetical protein
VNALNNEVLRLTEVFERMKQRTALQYSSFEWHREATIVRRNCAVTMGYEIVVPTGNVPNSGKTINRRYTNIYYLEDGGWRAIARQATNVAVQYTSSHVLPRRWPVKPTSAFPKTGAGRLLP